MLKYKLIEYVRLAAAGETGLVTDRDRVVAEIAPPRTGRSPLLAEDRTPPETLWQETLWRAVCSNTKSGAGSMRAASAGRTAKGERSLIGRVALLEMAPPVLGRALEPFPMPVRTRRLLLASVELLRGRGQSIELASYDDRLLSAARAMGIPLLTL